MSGSIVLALRLLMALALYAFLAWALLILWREIRRQGQTLSNRRVPSISLAVRQENGTQATRHFSQPEIILGRDPGCDIPLTDDTVSTRHAQLTYHHGQWWATDLSSTNGTFLNENILHMPTVITSGDEIKCGKVSLFISLTSDAFVSPTQRLDKKEN